MLIKRPTLRSEKNAEAIAVARIMLIPIAKSYPREGFLSNLHKEQKFHSAYNLPHGMKHNEKDFYFTVFSNIE